MQILLSAPESKLGQKLFSRLEAAGHTLFPLADPTDPPALAKAFDSFQADCIIHCQELDALSSEQNPALASIINTQGTARLAYFCASAHAKLIAFSSAAVFGGQGEKAYSEFDGPSGGVTTYGRTKWAAECAIRLACPHHLILRLSWPYDEETLQKLRSAPQLDTKAKGNPTSLSSIADAVLFFLTKPQTRGTFHLSCQGKTSWYDFAQELARLTKCELPCRPQEEANILPNLCLENKLMKLSNFPLLPSWQEDLHSFLEE